MSSMDAVHSTASPRVTTQRPVIAGFPATLSSIDVGGEAIALWEVADLERHVDRTALGRGAVRPHGIRRGRPHDRSPPRARGPGAGGRRAAHRHARLLLGPRLGGSGLAP